MSQPDTVPQFVAKMAKAAEGIPVANRVGVEQSALAAKETLLAAALTAGLRPGRRMRGVGRNGAPWGVRYDVKGGAGAIGFVRFYGPVHLVEGPTKPHQITPKGRRGRKGAKAITTPQGPRRLANHPGTSGKRFYSPAEQKVIQQTPPIFQAAHHRALVKVFGA